MSRFKSTDFTSLPFDVIEHIARYLCTNDLLTCSLVCIAWREVFNNDVLWIKRCKGGYGWKSYGELLENQKSYVQPFFELPQCPGKTLEPLCQWRIHFMAQIHFKRNQRLNRNKICSVKGDFRTDNTTYYGTESIVIFFTGLHSCEVWNTEDKPFLETVIYCALEGVIPFFYVEDNFIFILQLNLFQVYKKINGKYKLLHRRLFDQNEKLLLDIPFDTDITEWFINTIDKNINLRPPCMEYICFKEIFVGFNGTSDLTNCIFNIWDFKNGIKLKEQKFIDFPNPVSHVYFYKTLELFYIVFETEDPSHTKKNIIVAYNIVTQNYSDFRIEINCSHNDRYFFFERNYIISLHSNEIDIWDTDINNKKRTFIDLETSPFPYALVIHNSQLIYAGNSVYSNQLTMVDLKTLQKIQTLKVPCPIYRLMTSEANLLLMKCNISDYFNFSRDVFESEVSIWDLECWTKIFSFKIIDQFSGQLNFTKAILVQPNQFSIVHFW